MTHRAYRGVVFKPHEGYQICWIAAENAGLVWRLQRTLSKQLHKMRGVCRSKWENRHCCSISPSCDRRSFFVSQLVVVLRALTNPSRCRQVGSWTRRFSTGRHSLYCGQWVCLTQICLQRNKLNLGYRGSEVTGKNNPRTLLLSVTPVLTEFIN